MTNGEKFKTAKKRTEAFDEFCDNNECTRCPLFDTEEDRVLCAFSWLELEAKEEILKCPFCGSKADINTVGNKYFVRCHDCLIETPLCSSSEEVIAAWNRRV